MEIIKAMLLLTFVCSSMAELVKISKWPHNTIKKLDEGITANEGISKKTSTSKAIGSLKNANEEDRGEYSDVGLNTVGLIKKYGYPIERHENIETDDGYLLEMHRIPHGKHNSGIKNRSAVYVQHGLLSSSADWVAMGPIHGLGYLLADAGFDVWLGNFRGNIWSRKHKTYNPDKNKKEFWNFSWDEMGTYDVPAMIDYITRTTGQNKIFYIGHSQGTTSFFVMASERPQYMRRIKHMTALAPIAYMGNTQSRLLKFMVSWTGLVTALSNMMGAYEFLPSSEIFTEIGQNLCKDEVITQKICTNILFMIGGYNSQQLNTTMLPVILSNVPAGAATKQIFHYAQQISSGDFKKFDYGSMENFLVYGSTTPPSYDLTKLTAPIALFYGDYDNFASTQDVDRLYNALRGQVDVYKKEVNEFNHLDFLWGINATKTYERVISLMKRYD